MHGMAICSVGGSLMQCKVLRSDRRIHPGLLPASVVCRTNELEEECSTFSMLEGCGGYTIGLFGFVVFF